MCWPLGVRHALAVAAILTSAACPQPVPPNVDLVRELNFCGNPNDVRAIAVDREGNLYFAGHSYTTTCFLDVVRLNRPSIRGSDFNIFVVKMDALASRTIYTTVLGGSGFEVVGSLAVDAAGAAYIAGHTSSTDFPSARRASTRETGTFILKLRPSGNAVEYVTILGQGGVPQALAVSASGTAYVGGLDSNDSSGAKVDPSGTATVSPQISGALDGARSIAVRPSGDVVVLRNNIAVYDPALSGARLSITAKPEYRLESLGFDQTGNIYAAGAIYRDAIATGHAVVLKFDSSGTLVYERLIYSVAAQSLFVTPGGEVNVFTAWAAHNFATRNATQPCLPNRAPIATPLYGWESDPGFIVLALDGSVKHATFTSAALRAAAASPTGSIYALANVRFPVPYSEDRLIRIQPDRIPSAARVAPACLVNAGSYKTAAASPGEIMTLYGSSLGPPTVRCPARPLCRFPSS